MAGVYCCRNSFSIIKYLSWGVRPCCSTTSNSPLYPISPAPLTGVSTTTSILQARLRLRSNGFSEDQVLAANPLGANNLSIACRTALFGRRNPRNHTVDQLQIQCVWLAGFWQPRRPASCLYSSYQFRVQVISLVKLIGRLKRRGWCSSSFAETFKICGMLSLYWIQAEDIGTYAWRTNMGSLVCLRRPKLCEIHIICMKPHSIIYIWAMCIEWLDIYGACFRFVSFSLSHML